MVADQFVQNLTEHVVTFGTDLVAQFTLEVSDSFRQLGQDAVALGGATHNDGSSIVRVLLHRDQFEFLKFPNSLTDRLPGDPTIGENRWSRAVWSDETQDPSVRSTQHDAHRGQSFGQCLADSALQCVDPGHDVRNG